MTPLLIISGIMLINYIVLFTCAPTGSRLACRHYWKTYPIILTVITGAAIMANYWLLIATPWIFWIATAVLLLSWPIRIRGLKEANHWLLQRYGAQITVEKEPLPQTTPP